jgi:hypothetical protein
MSTLNPDCPRAGRNEKPSTSRGTLDRRSGNCGPDSIAPDPGAGARQAATDCGANIFNVDLRAKTLSDPATVANLLASVESAFKHGYREGGFYEVLETDPLKLRARRGLKASTSD